MPNQDDNTDDLDNLIDFYHKVWGLKPSEAANQAFEDQRRGPKSSVWTNRVKQASDWKAKHPNKPPASQADYPAAPYDPAMNPYGAGAPKPMEPNPESAMADPRYGAPKPSIYMSPPPAGNPNPNPESAMGTLPSKPKAGFEDMYQFYRNGLHLSPEEAIKRASADYSQSLANNPPPPPPPPQPTSPVPPPVPVAPMPLKPAAQTPHHLEDANLSSWQALAQYMGYSPPRR